MKNYLGIDWGATNIGIALAHAETRVALPYETLKNDGEVFMKIGDIITSENIGTVVVGIPTFRGEENKEQPAKQFGQMLVNQFPVEVLYYDEMFTTKMAQVNLSEQGVKCVSKNNDEEASRIILQDWLDRTIK